MLVELELDVSVVDVTVLVVMVVVVKVEVVTVLVVTVLVVVVVVIEVVLVLVVSVVVDVAVVVDVVVVVATHVPHVTGHATDSFCLTKTVVVGSAVLAVVRAVVVVFGTSIESVLHGPFAVLSRPARHQGEPVSGVSLHDACAGHRARLRARRRCAP